MAEAFWAIALRLLAVAGVAALIKAGVALAEHSIAWWLAFVISAVVVFGGMLILGDWTDCR